MPKIDARMISLFSRDAKKDPFPRFLEEETTGYSFSFYDAIDVKKAEIYDGPAHRALLETYEKGPIPVKDPCAPFSYRQVLFAFRDITDEEADPSSPKSIDRFWDGSEDPLLFVSMINVKSTGNIQEALDEIDRLFDREHCRAYLTFDHCDIIIFFKGRGFADFVNRIFKLNYGYDMVEDTITLFTFLNEKRFPREKYAALSNEKFGVNIRVGVRDFPGFVEFQKKFTGLDSSCGTPKTIFRRLLGRNDVAICNSEASMAWLAGLKDILDADMQEAAWHTTYDMEILVPCDAEERYVSPPPPASSESALCRKMRECCGEFEKKYQDRCGEMNVTADEVCLRWLKKTSALSVSFFENRLSADLGTCLVPQFFDILEYGKRFFDSEKVTRGHMDKIRWVFREFFSNISILIDSLNHSNRQFIQFPSYNSISFEMPPKIMAYFCVLAKRLVQVFQDEKELLYGVTISPKFACELDVSSLAANQVLERDELIAISIEEGSLYSLPLTTEAMAHEISHFVGEKNRCRERRREFFVKCAAAELIDDMIFGIQEELAKSCGVSRMPEEERVLVEWDSVQALVGRLWEILSLVSAGEEAAPPRNMYLLDVYRECLNLPGTIGKHDSLQCNLLEWLREVLGEEGFAFKLLIQKNAENLGLPELAEEESWSPDKLEELKRGPLWAYCVSFAGEEIYRAMRRLLADDAAKNKEIELMSYAPLYGENYNITAHIYYMFSETFADLQTILLFGMNLEDYYQLLLKGQPDGAYDALPRMVAVARALVKKGRWGERELALSESGSTAQVLLRAIRLEEENIVLLQDDGISPNLIFYLTQYLSECVDAILETLEDHAALRDQLRGIHKSLKTETSIRELSGKMLEFIDEYRRDLSFA